MPPSSQSFLPSTVRVASQSPVALDSLTGDERVRSCRRADGTLLTQHCPPGLRVVRARWIHFWQRAVATILWMSASMSPVLAEDDALIPRRIPSLRQVVVSPKVPPYVPHTDGKELTSKGRDIDIDTDFGPYMKTLRQKILSRWNPPKKINPTKLVIVTFEISQSGQLSDLKLTHRADDSASNLAAMAAVERASPFLNLPSGADDAIKIQFNFEPRSTSSH